ncbi:MAG: ATP-dependent helicase [Woeseiaceae bacterium]|nr:ATP-dependent helicase [Woeseiaceae bacterium]
MIDVIRHEQKQSSTSRRFPEKDTCLSDLLALCEFPSTADPGTDEDVSMVCRLGAELTALFRGYVERKQQAHSLDYDDLLLYWSYLVADAELAQEISGRFEHVLVDEYQDTNLVQAEILRAIAKDGQGLTVVGDDAQSIYAFRAAEVDNILSFSDQYTPPATIISLEENYRSLQPILDSANCLIAEGERQYRKSLFTQKRMETPNYTLVEDSDAEAEFVVTEILGNRERGMQLRDQAVLFRSAHHSDRLELELVRRNIPYVKYGGLKFLEASHVKDLLSVLKWAENPRNEVAAFRVLKLLPGVGPASASRCFDSLALADFAWSAMVQCKVPAAARDDWPAFSDLMMSLAGHDAAATDWRWQVGAVRRWYRPHLERLNDEPDVREADLEQLEQISARYPTRERFLTELTLDPPAASGDLAGDPLLDEDYVTLSTVHSAKGQEWDAVFVINFSDGNFPSEFATGSPDMIDEERRLLYVAMTRARKSLDLIAPLRYHVTRQHKHGDRHIYGARSRFVTDGLLATLAERYRGRDDASSRDFKPRTDRTIDVAAKLREMW